MLTTIIELANNHALLQRKPQTQADVNRADDLALPTADLEVANEPTSERAGDRRNHNGVRDPKHDEDKTEFGKLCNSRTSL
ncbi:hypothetical protein GFM44_30850 [Rhizobium leguminosarum bv. viciae]|nr:hypothetical protein [Rhizobium leguminosarum bv. viciae]